MTQAILTLDQNGPDNDYIRFEKEWLERPIFDLFTQIVKNYPDKIAVDDGENRFTYTEAYNIAVNIANQVLLINKSNAPIGIALNNNAIFPIIMMAITFTGFPYVPMDMSIPDARNTLIAEHSGMKVVIVEEDTMQSVNNINPNLDIVNISSGLNTINLLEKYEYVDKSKNYQATSDSIAYIIYTSGSTGKPKGVFQNQRNLLHDVMQYTNSIHLSSADKLTLLYSPSVNGAIRDIYGCLLNGATLFVINLRKQGFQEIERVIKDNKITIYHSIPTIFRAFMKLHNIKESLKSIRLIYMAGDRIFSSDVELFKENFSSQCLLYVGIGSTENATIYRQWFINHKMTIHQPLIPLGYPVTDRDMTINDSSDLVLPDGEQGEIVVKSKYMALGYWNDPDLTEKFFKKDISNPDIRIFHTGDLGFINKEGQLEFLGRKDNQLKIRGYRVETDDIEANLRQCNQIDEVAVIVDNHSLENKLIAFIVPDKNLYKSVESINSWILKNLPVYMQPEKINIIEFMPTLFNLKYDRKALKKMYLNFENSNQISALNQNIDSVNLSSLITDNNPESNDIDNRIFNAVDKSWSLVFNIKTDIPDKSWQNMGGNSLMVLEIIYYLENILKIKVKPELITPEVTPNELIKRLKIHVLSKDDNKDDSSKQILFFVPPIAWIGYTIPKFIEQLAEADINVEMLKFPDIQTINSKYYKLDNLMNEWIEIIKSYNQKHIYLLGFSFGGRLAFDLGRRLSIQGIKVDFLGILDMSPQGKVFKVDFPVSKFTYLAKVIAHSLIPFKLVKDFSLESKLFKSAFIKKSYLKISKEVIQILRRRLIDSYYPSYFEADITLFRINDEITSWNDIPGDTGWSKYCRKVNIINISGKHNGFFSSENSEELGKIIIELFNDLKLNTKVN